MLFKLKLNYKVILKFVLYKNELYSREEMFNETNIGVI
jgi:hypothetical protein